MIDTPKRADRQEIARRVERGEKLLQKGKPAEALEEFLQTLALDPANDTVRQMAADLCLSLQRMPDAVRLLGDLFERQLAVGDAIRASLTYKKLARFANPSFEQKKRFAELLEKSNRKLAIETYESVFEELSKQGRKSEALPVLKKIVGLEGSERNLTRLGELASEVGDGKQAAASFLQLAQMAEGAGGDPSQWFERAYSEDAMDEIIAIGYARSLMQQQQVGAAIFVLDPLAAAGSTSAEFRDLYARALLSANRLTEAAPLVWQIFEQNPSRIEQVRDLIGAFLDSQLDREAVVLAEKLEHFQRRKGERRAFLAMMQDIVAGHRASVEMLEFLAEQFNSANREADYCATLLRLFELYCKENKFDKAGEALDRAVEIDPYENGHQKRLQALKGKIDENRYQVISSRLGGTAPATPVRNQVEEEKSIGSGTLQDLMVQAEILVQYGMRNKALERLQRIQQLFPHEEDRNPELQQLYVSAGLMPQYGNTPPVASTPTAAPRASADLGGKSGSFDSDVSGFARVSDITKKLNRENSADGVLNTMAVEIGTHWSLDRCVAVLRKPGLGVSTLKEFTAAGNPAKADVLEKLICGIHDVVVSRGNLACTDIGASPELNGVASFAIAIGVRSCVALPLGEGAELGLLLLLSNTPRSWSPNDVLIFKMIADQGGMALNNAGLRRLVKNLSVTDENSGLLKRASYLDLLLGEVRRAKQQNAPLSVMVMRFGERAALAKEQGEAAAESVMQRLGQVVAANVRQNDLAFRYSANAIAIVLGETAEKEALLVAEKMRRVMSSAVPEKQFATQFNAGVAEGVMRPEFDAVDIVTELINRAERSLEKAVAEGPGKSAALKPAMTAAAVA